MYSKVKKQLPKGYCKMKESCSSALAYSRNVCSYGVWSKDKKGNIVDPVYFRYKYFPKFGENPMTSVLNEEAEDFEAFSKAYDEFQLRTEQGSPVI